MNCHSQKRFFLLLVFTLVLEMDAQQVDPLGHSRELIKNKQISEAVALLQPYVAAHPESADAHYLLGYALYQSKAPTRSLEQYTIAAKIREPSSEDLMAVAADYILLEGYGDAIKWLTVVTQREPTNRLAWYYLARAFYANGQYESAAKTFEQVLALMPHDVSAETGLGLVYEAQGDEKRALQAYANAIEWQKLSVQQDQQPYLRSGVLLNKQAHPEQALTFLLQADQYGTNNPLLHEQLGRVYEELGRHKEAESHAEKAIALEPDAASLHFLLGRIYREEGLSSKAKEQFALTSKLMGSKSSPETLNFDLKQ